ncbi:MAG: Lrp/AsnC ligand binding domain-containing protein [Theionarchaea archaeon]|nr:Lrp/AsnC ligand binding domain-containing protein [Theionarchaea archaeon]
MLYAYILLTVRIGMLKQALEEVRKLDDVIEADAITGPYDMVVYLGVEGLTQLTKTLLHQIETIDGVTESMTLVVVDI